MATSQFFERLTPETFRLYAARFYDNPGCQTLKEFESDMDVFNALHKSLLRYVGMKVKEPAKSRAIVNYIQILLNIFGPEPASRMIVYKLGEDKYLLLPALKAFLTFMNSVPPVYDIRQVKTDWALLQSLREMEG